MLKWQLDGTKIQGNNMSIFFTKIKDPKERLHKINEVISNKQLACKIFAAFSHSYHGFTTTIRLLTRGKESYNINEQVPLLLWEPQSRANQDVRRMEIKL